MTGSDRPGVVERAEDITAPWMTAALRDSGFEAEATRLSFAPVGTGQVADSFRFEVTYASSAGRAPGSVVVKMQAADERSRNAGAGGVYHAEVSFYTDLVPTLRIRTPECHYAVASNDGSRFALVLEDLAPAEQGDQLEGCSIEQARTAVVNLAGLHGPRWCDPSLYDLAWLRRVSEEAAAGLQAVLVNNTDQFIDFYGSRVSESDAAVLTAFAEKSGSWLTGRSERFSVVHGDYRLDNLLFATPAGGAPVATVDWQTLEHHTVCLAGGLAARRRDVERTACSDLVDQPEDFLAR